MELSSAKKQLWSHKHPNCHALNCSQLWDGMCSILCPETGFETRTTSSCFCWGTTPPGLRFCQKWHHGCIVVVFIHNAVVENKPKDHFNIWQNCLFAAQDWLSCFIQSPVVDVPCGDFADAIFCWTGQFLEGLAPKTLQVHCNIWKQHEETFLTSEEVATKWLLSLWQQGAKQLCMNHAQSAQSAFEPAMTTTKMFIWINLSILRWFHTLPFCLCHLIKAAKKSSQQRRLWSTRNSSDLRHLTPLKLRLKWTATCTVLKNSKGWNHDCCWSLKWRRSQHFAPVQPSDLAGLHGWFWLCFWHAKLWHARRRRKAWHHFRLLQHLSFSKRHRWQESNNKIRRCQWFWKQDDVHLRQAEAGPCNSPQKSLVEMHRRKLSQTRVHCLLEKMNHISQRAWRTCLSCTRWISNVLPLLNVPSRIQRKHQQNLEDKNNLCLLETVQSDVYVNSNAKVSSEIEHKHPPQPSLLRIVAV